MSQFSTEAEAINWYDAQERVLTKEFLETIPWHDVKNYPISSEFIPIVTYMRDVERLTDYYYRYLLKTPTGHDYYVRRFIDKWSVEEILHADLLNRFLEEAGVPVSKNWYERVKNQIPLSTRFKDSVTKIISHGVGKNFCAVHMTWGSIQELSTLNGYKRLWEKAKHPVLEYILRGIAREEAVHAFFYWNLARLKLERSTVAQKLSRYIIQNFWLPIGQSEKREPNTNYLIRTLFSGIEGLDVVDKNINKRLGQLPGFSGIKKVTEHISEVACSNFFNRGILST